MNFGYSSQQVGDVKALWEGDVFDIPGFERPRAHERKKAINIQNQQSLLQGYKPYWQEAVETMDASLVSDKLIRMVPIIPYMFVDAYLKKEYPRTFHRETLKAALAQLQAKGMTLSMSMLVDLFKIRENATQDKIEETIRIFFELNADMTSPWPTEGSSVLTEAILFTKNKFIAEILLKYGATFLTPQESYHMIRTICSEQENQAWFLQHKHQLLQAGLDVNAKDHNGLTVLENILGSDSSQLEMALQMGVNPQLPDGLGNTIEDFYNHRIGLQTYEIVREQMNNNMQILRRHLLLKQMHDVYMRHAQTRPEQGSVLTHVQRLPLHINQQILEYAYGKDFNSEPSYMVSP